MTDSHRTEVRQRAGYRCEYCGYSEAASSTPLEVNHIIPEAKGGPTTIDNLALCCRSCNLYKHIKTEGIDPATGVTVPLFHPRRQPWLEHFLLDRSTGIIRGSTSIGRATVEALNLIATYALATRRLLIQLGLM
jgi:hypothetical protein